MPGSPNRSRALNVRVPSGPFLVSRTGAVRSIPIELNSGKNTAKINWRTINRSSEIFLSISPNRYWYLAREFFRAFLSVFCFDLEVSCVFCSFPCHMYHKSIATTAKLHELLFEFFLHPDLALSDYWLFADLKRMLQGKRSGSNEEVISETEVYFEVKDKSHYKKRYQIVSWNVGISVSP